MSTVETIKGAICRSLGVVNELLPPEQVMLASDDLILLGPGAGLDSMGFVNFIIALEEELERALGRDFSVGDLLNIHADDGSEMLTVAGLVRVLNESLA